MNKLKQFLSRPTNSVNFIPEIDGLRFFAIFTVLIFHLNTAFSKELGVNLQESFNLLGNENFLGIGWWIRRFDVGVKVFFAISGFILAVPFLKQYLNLGEKINIKDYFIRRLTRLEPPFVLSLLFFYLIHIFILNVSSSSTIL